MKGQFFMRPPAAIFQAEASTFRDLTPNRSLQATRKQMNPATQRRKKIMTAPSIGPNRASSEWLAGTSVALKIRLFLPTLYAILVMPEVEHRPGHRMPAGSEQKDDAEKARKTGFCPGI
jgi:hypothetical protein